MIEDVRGLKLSTDSNEAVEAYDHALCRYLEYRSDTAKTIARAIEADPDFVMPRVLMASLMRLMGSESIRPQIDEQIEAIDRCAGDLTPREQLHVRALNVWCDGDLDLACRIWEDIVLRWPHDLLALRHLHFQNFWMGRATSMRNTVAGALGAWDENLQGYGFVQGMLAFGMEECGDYARAEQLGREAVERNPEDMWSIHAVAHVLEMQGRIEDGLGWTDFGDDRWQDRGPFKTHLWWHGALFALENGAFERVLELYDQHIRPGERLVSTDLQNAASLLARLEFQGVDVGDRWEKLANWARGWIGDHVIAFTDAHAMLPLARCGREDDAEALLASLEAFAVQFEGYAASITKPFILPIAEGIKAFYDGAPEQTVSLLRPLRDRLQPIGGSHAQRDLFAQLLLEAAIAAGDWPLARQLARERTVLRPHNHLNWLKLAKVLDAAGDSEAAQNARRRAAA